MYRIDFKKWYVNQEELGFNINVSNIELSAIKSAKLTLAVWDVDFECGMPGECERDTVYVNGHRLTTPEPFLTGANGQWSTVTFNIEPGWIIEGDNYIEIYIDTLNTGYWCVQADWGELALEMKDIDLKVESKDISISPTQWWKFWEYPFDISVNVHNNGIEKAENVEVKIVREYRSGTYIVELENEIKTISEIPAGGSAQVSLDWNLNFDEDIEVIADPSDKLEESNEDNNKALTTKTSGSIQNSDGQPMAHLPVTYQEKVGNDWVDTEITVYTDGVGKYYIINNLNAITSGREGRTKADLIYSPTHDAGTTVFRIIDETEWGNGVTPSSRTPVSKHPNWWTMDKSTDYTSDMTFTDNEGGIAYVTLVTAYNYQKNRGTAPSDETLIEINDDDLGGAQARPWLHTINLPPGLRGTNRPSAIGHEYTHVVELGWSVAGTGGSHNPLTPVEEASSHWGSSEARNSQIYQYPDGNNGYINIDISDNAQTNGGPPTPGNFLGAREEFQMAGTMWDLAEDLDRENEVWSTLRFGGFWWWQYPDTPRNFYAYYLDRDSNPSPTIKNVFRAHGYNTTGWPGKNGDDPYYFTGNYKDFKIDKNSDGIAEYLNIDVEVDIPTQGYYILSGGIQGLELGASNYSYLDSGIQNVSLKFYGEAFFESGLNGPYNLSVFLGDGTYAILDYRIGSYLTSGYSFTEFARPIILFTGNYNHYGIDSDSNGLYDYLTMDVEVNVTIAGNYEVYGNLYAGDAFIDYVKNYTYLNEGISTIKLNFDGVTIHANSINGPYKLKDLTIPGSYPVYTSAYSYTEFQSPSANLGSIISDSGIDTDADGLYNQLAVMVNTDCSLPGNYTISGYLHDSIGRHIISGYKNTNLISGSQNIQLDFDGTIIRNEGKNGPYNLTIELYDSNGAFIGKKTGVTSYYDFTQFQISSQDYFETTFKDYGLDIDNNGLFDYLTVELNISSDIKAGDYRLDGYFHNENGNVAFASSTGYVDTQTRIVKLNFSGQDIWRSKIFDSSYNLDIGIYDSNSHHVVKLQNVHMTSKYRYTDFQSPKAIFKDLYSDQGVDLNSDGFYEYLVSEVGVNVTIAGNYTMYGLLDDINGNMIIENNNLTYLNTGYQTIILNFDGTSIYKYGVNGPYNLTNLLLYDETGTLIDIRNYAYTTSAYDYKQFQRPPVLLTGNYIESPIDANGNGFYDDLAINVEIIVQNAGSYALNARLMDENENEIGWAATNSWLSGGKPETMQLNFDGISINKNGINGPYFLRDLYIYNMYDVSKSANAYNAYTTTPYKYFNFEFPIVTETSTGTGVAYFTSDAGDIQDLISINELELPTEGKPNILFPHGFFSFKITGLTLGQPVNVSIAFPSNIPTYAQYWKYNSAEGWYQIPIGSNDGDSIITIQLKDGGLGDDDGIANHIIEDAGGPGTSMASIATKLEYIGDLTAQYSDFVTLKAQLNDSGNNNPLSGKTINFTLGTQTATAITGADGVTSTTLKLDQQAGSYNVKAEFVGDDDYGSDSDTEPFSITHEDTTITYTGDMIVPRISGSINLRATLEEIDTDYGDLTKIKVNFTIYKSSDSTYSNPIATVPSVASISVTSSGTGIGTAKATINNLPVDDYMVIARIVPNDYYKPITSAPTPLTVYEPTGKFTTGGGWILDTVGSHGSFGFTVKYNKQGKVQGNSLYIYRQNGLDYIVKSNAWIGLAIKGITSSFQGKASLQIYDPTTGLLQPGSSGNFQFTVEAVDNELSKTLDTYKITVLDKNGSVYHNATGQLQGGNIVIHEK